MAATGLTVLQLLPALQSGGVERGTLEVAHALVAAGHRSLVMSAGGRLVQELVADGSEHITLPVGSKSLWSLRLVPRLRRLLQRERIDILHARSRMPAWLAWLAWRGMPHGERPRFITTVHGLYSVNAWSRIMTRGERVIAVSDTARDYILRNYPDVVPERIVTIHRGVSRREFPYGFQPADSWRAAWFEEFPQLRGRKLLILPGRLTRLKGHADFIDLIAGLVADSLPVHGLIVGHLDRARRRYIGELRARIADAGLQQHITFTGQRSDIREIYSVSSLVLSLSHKPESFGRTVLEPLCLGVPVLGYDHGGVGEILAAVYPAGCVARGDGQLLLERCKALLGMPVPVAESDAFRLETMLERTLALYSELASERVRGGQ